MTINYLFNLNYLYICTKTATYPYSITICVELVTTQSVHYTIIYLINLFIFILFFPFNVFNLKLAQS